MSSDRAFLSVQNGKKTSNTNVKKSVYSRTINTKQQCWFNTWLKKILLKQHKLTSSFTILPFVAVRVAYFGESLSCRTEHKQGYIHYIFSFAFITATQKSPLSCLKGNVETCWIYVESHSTLSKNNCVMYTYYSNVNLASLTYLSAQPARWWMDCCSPRFRPCPSTLFKHRKSREILIITIFSLYSTLYNFLDLIYLRNIVVFCQKFPR